ncbi:MAG: alkene reductase [Bacteroidota bacterium]
MKLLEQIKIGDLTLQNRMAMAPMTRSRASVEGVVGEMTATYYVQRASAGLLISEAINISEQAIGSPFTPGLYTPAQIEAWKNVTDQVHAAGGVIFAQLWHTGRVGHSLVKHGALPVSASAIGIKGQQHFTPDGMKDYETPRALSTEEVKQVVQDYKTAAENAKTAGFDGVELHGAFGYLPNQFLVDGANHRTDEYGGSIENRSRFVLEVMQAMVDVWGPDKVAIKLSPSIPYNGMIDSNPEALFSYLIGELNKMPLAYLHLMQALFPLTDLPHYPKDVLNTFGPLFNKTVMANGGFNRETAEAEIDNERAQMISFGALFLANPDLPKRFELNAELNTPDRATMYGGGEKGYTDYPFLS